MGYPPDAYILGLPDVGEFTTLGAGPGAMVGGMPHMGITGPPHGDQQSLFVHENRRHIAPGHKSTIGAHANNFNSPYPD
jgi:hypothetical protein